jgi:hypothetical protein
MIKKPTPQVDPNRIIPGITSFAWNANCSKVAVCPQSREVLIFETNNQPEISKWKLTQVLKEVSVVAFSVTIHLFSRDVALQRYCFDALASNDWLAHDLLD